MRIPPSSEYIHTINDLLKTQNRRVKKYLRDEENVRSGARVQIVEVMDKWAALKKYISEWMLPEIEYTLVDNLRYIIEYFEGTYEENKQPYFKIIIRNKISGAENFIIVSYDLRNITIKISGVEPPEEGDLDTQIFSLEKFTKGKLRRIFFELFQARIIADTLPKKKKKKPDVEEEVIIQNPYIAVLREEIARMRMISERNKQMILEANAKKFSMQAKRKKEINKMLGKKDDIKELPEKNEN